MAKISFQRSIRFTKDDWDAVVEAAEKTGLTPSSFVRRAAVSAATGHFRLDSGGVTPELAELVKRTFRGVHLLTYLKRDELNGSGNGPRFDRAADDARVAQIKALGTDRPDEVS